MSQRKPFIVGMGGTTRPGSSSEQALAFALAHARTLGARAPSRWGQASRRCSLPYAAPWACLPRPARLWPAPARRANPLPSPSGSLVGGLRSLTLCGIHELNRFRALFFIHELNYENRNQKFFLQLFWFVHQHIQVHQSKLHYFFSF
jgi:hypothetical protein